MKNRRNGPSLDFDMMKSVNLDVITKLKSNPTFVFQLHHHKNSLIKLNKDESISNVRKVKKERRNSKSIISLDINNRKKSRCTSTNRSMSSIELKKKSRKPSINVCEKTTVSFNKKDAGQLIDNRDSGMGYFLGHSSQSSKIPTKKSSIKKTKPTKQDVKKPVKESQNTKTSTSSSKYELPNSFIFVQRLFSPQNNKRVEEYNDKNKQAEKEEKKGNSTKNEENIEVRKSIGNEKKDLPTLPTTIKNINIISSEKSNEIIENYKESDCKTTNVERFMFEASYAGFMDSSDRYIHTIPARDIARNTKYTDHSEHIGSKEEGTSANNSLHKMQERLMNFNAANFDQDNFYKFSSNEFKKAKLFNNINSEVNGNEIDRKGEMIPNQKKYTITKKLPNSEKKIHENL